MRITLQDTPFGIESESYIHSHTGDWATGVHVDFGTVAGAWSIAELKDLIASHDAIIAQLTASYSAFSPEWAQKDAAGLAAFGDDYQAMLSRYNSAKVAANAAIAASAVVPLSDAMTPAGPGIYDGILNALKQNPATVSKGDLDDLSNRLEAAQKAAGATVLVYTNIPQPSKGSDVDISVLTAAQQATSHIVDPIVGDKSLDPSKRTPLWNLVPWYVYVAGGILILMIGGVAVQASGAGAALSLLKGKR